MEPANLLSGAGLYNEAVGSGKTAFIHASYRELSVRIGISTPIAGGAGEISQVLFANGNSHFKSLEMKSSLPSLIKHLNFI